MGKNYLVLMYDEARKVILGSGFIGRYKKENYVITCKHQIWNVNSENLFAIPTPRINMDFSISNMLNLNKPLYHPKDKGDDTYDIAISIIKNYQDVADSNNLIDSISLDLIDSYIEPSNGHQVMARGFTVEYLTRQIGKIGGGPFSYEEMEGEVREYKEVRKTYSGFTGNLIETFFVKTEKNQNLGVGGSGGIVLLKKSGQLIPYGIILAKVEGEFHSKSGNVTENLYGNTFAQFKRVMEVIQFAKKITF